MKPEQMRLEAIGERGEACVIVRTGVPRAAGERAQAPDAEATFRLATGERLQPTSKPGVLETLDGARRFTLREAVGREHPSEPVSMVPAPDKT